MSHIMAAHENTQMPLNKCLNGYAEQYNDIWTMGSSNAYD